LFSEVNWYLITAMILCLIGVYGMVIKRNAIRIVIGIEILTSGIHLNFIALGVAVSPTQIVDVLAQTIVILSIVIGACVATVALMFIIQAYRHYGTIDVRRLRRLRW